MIDTPAFRVTIAEPAHEQGLARLFASNGYECHCRFWHFSGTSREWLARCFQEPGENERQMRVQLAAGSIEMRGVVAQASGEGGGNPGEPAEIIGWLKLAPSEAIPKLYEQRLYKGLPAFSGDRSGTYAVACLLVREDQRRRGVARALLSGAIEAARSWGARRIEAFPRTDTDVPGSALMTGPAQLFLDAGFEVVHDFRPYPILRLALGGGTP